MGVGCAASVHLKLLADGLLPIRMRRHYLWPVCTFYSATVVNYSPFSPTFPHNDSDKEEQPRPWSLHESLDLVRQHQRLFTSLLQLLPPRRKALFCGLNFSLVTDHSTSRGTH